MRSAELAPVNPPADWDDEHCGCVAGEYPCPCSVAALEEEGAKLNALLDDVGTAARTLWAYEWVADKDSLDERRRKRAVGQRALREAASSLVRWLGAQQ